MEACSPSRDNTHLYHGDMHCAVHKCVQPCTKLMDFIHFHVELRMDLYYYVYKGLELCSLFVMGDCTDQLCVHCRLYGRTMYVWNLSCWSFSFLPAFTALVIASYLHNNYYYIHELQYIQCHLVLQNWLTMLRERLWKWKSCQSVLCQHMTFCFILHVLHMGMCRYICIYICVVYTQGIPSFLLGGSN